MKKKIRKIRFFRDKDGFIYVVKNIEGSLFYKSVLIKAESWFEVTEFTIREHKKSKWITEIPIHEAVLCDWYGSYL